MRQFTIFLLLTAFSIINLQAQDHAFELGYILIGKRNDQRYI